MRPQVAEDTVRVIPVGKGVVRVENTPEKESGMKVEVGVRGTPRPRDTPKVLPVEENTHTSATSTRSSNTEFIIPAQTIEGETPLDKVEEPEARAPLRFREATSSEVQGCPVTKDAREVS